MKRKSDKLVAGVGVNDADYPVVRFGKDINGKRNREWVCPFYKTWSAMLNRCYRNPVQKAYKDTTVCEEWHTFSNFRNWMEQQNWEGKDLDKDLLTDSNHYSPENCIFISEWLNTFISGERETSDINLIGIYKDNGYYTICAHKKNLWDAESFLEVEDAIQKYFTVRVGFIKQAAIEDDLKNLVIEFFIRRKLQHQNIVINNPEEFTNRGFPIQGTNMPRVGDRFKTFKGYWYTVKAVKGCEEILIEFDDGELKNTRNTRIKDGKIKKSTRKDRFATLMSRVDKVFKWNSHGLISGIQFYPPKHYGVAFKEHGVSKCFYTTLIEEAVDFRKEMLLKRVVKIVGKDVKYLEDVLNYFITRWDVEVVKYSGKFPQTV